MDFVLKLSTHSDHVIPEVLFFFLKNMSLWQAVPCLPSLILALWNGWIECECVWAGGGGFDWQGGTQMRMWRMLSVTWCCLLISRCSLQMWQGKGVKFCSLIGLHHKYNPPPSSKLWMSSDLGSLLMVALTCFQSPLCIGVCWASLITRANEKTLRVPLLPSYLQPFKLLNPLLACVYKFCISIHLLALSGHDTS